MAGQSGTSSLTTDNAIVINSNRADHPFLRGLDTGYCCNMMITSVSKDEGAPTLAGTCVTILSSNIVVDAGYGGCPLAQVPGNSLHVYPPPTSHETGIPYQMTYPDRDVKVRPGKGLSSLVLCCAFCLLAHLVSPSTGYRHPVQCYDYMSDNLADDFVALNRRNALIIK